MKRKGMGKRIAAIVLAITMSISTAGFQTGIVKAQVAEGAVVTTTTETTTAGTPAESGDSAADVGSADETATDSTITEGNETNDEGSIGEETTDPVITDEEATGDVADEENADGETNGVVSEEDEITDGEEIADEELTPEELAAKLAAEEEARLAAEEEARLAAEKEAARIRAELLATSPEIISQYTEGNVTVNVQAPEGAFPGGTTVSIAPVYQTNDLVDAIDSVETTEDIVAFDITFYDIDGYEIQPRDGYTVNVSFELAASSELARDDATLQVYHIDDAQNATPVGAEIPSSSEGVEVSVEAESFSVYAVVITTPDDNNNLLNKKTVDAKAGETVTLYGSIHFGAYDHDWKIVDDKSSLCELSKSLTHVNATVKFNTNTPNGESFIIRHTWYTGVGRWKTQHHEDFVVTVNIPDLSGNTITVTAPTEAVDFDTIFTKNENQTVEGKSSWDGRWYFDAENAQSDDENGLAQIPGEIKVYKSRDDWGHIDLHFIKFDIGDEYNWQKKVYLDLSPAAANKTYTLIYQSFAGNSWEEFLNLNKETVCEYFTINVQSPYQVTYVNGNNEPITKGAEWNGKQYVAPIPEEPVSTDGKKFLGWYNGEEEYNFDEPITSDLTLTAKWEEEKNYNAEFYLLKKVNVIPLENGSTQYPAKDYSAKDLENMVGVVSNTAFVSLGDEENITNLNLAEAFQPVQGVISRTPEDEYLATVKSQILAEQGYTENLDKYDILWYVVKKAAGTYHVDGVVYDKTLNYRSLTYYANINESEKPLSSEALPFGTSVTVAAAPEREGYTFNGWNTEKNGSGDRYVIGGTFDLEKDITLYAQWKKNKVNDVNFYIQLFTEVMDTEGNIKHRPVNLFSGSVATSTMNENVAITEKYAGAIDNVTAADQTIRGDWLGRADRIADCPTAGAIFENLRNDAKTKKHFNNEVDMLTADNYDIYWYVVKYHGDGWHVDGILQPKKSTTPDPVVPTPTPTPVVPTPTPDPEGPTPTPGPTPDPGTTEIPDDETPLAPNPGDDVDDDKTVEPTESTDIDDEDVPLSDGTDIDDEDVPLADFPTEDDAEVTDILDEETPLSDNPMTGDSASVLWAIMAMLSAFGLTAVAVTGKRKREE